MKKNWGFIVGIFLFSGSVFAQNPVGLSMDEYIKAKAFLIKDLDNESYVKFENNTYILDRYEAKKPYFITGDDGLKKRIDLYTLTKKGSEQILGTVIYYTNEKNKVFTACLPNNAADGKVWNQYFEDIHAIDKVEKNFVLKLSYVLSKELGFQQYKASLKGKEIDRSEAGTYGNDICFPGDETVAMADGTTKFLVDIQPGDKVVTVDPITQTKKIATVNKLVSHNEDNYAITTLTLIKADEIAIANGNEVHLSVRQLQATPNHPVTTKKGGSKKIGSVVEGEQLLCQNQQTGKYETFTVWNKTEKAGGVQKVYNIEASEGATFIMNGVMVMQKAAVEENK
jgi:hypothetical protein